MGRFVIAVYRPKPAMRRHVLAAVGKHMPVLRAEGLITERPAHVMRAVDGTVVEVFEALAPASQSIRR